MATTQELAFYEVWAKVTRPEHGCWTWRSKSKGVAGGYHQVTIGYHPVTGNNVLKVASRLVYEVMYGGPLPKGMEVAHLCNNAGCIKPSHLVMGTRAQNERMKDPHRSALDRRKTMYAVK